MPCIASCTRFIFLESFHIYYNLICIFICLLFAQNFILEKNVGVTVSGLGLLQGLPLLKFESNLVCAPCRHGKMFVASHSLINSMMTERPRQLLHMDTVGLSWVHFVGGKWYVLVIVDDYSRYSWVFFLESKNEVFEHFRSLALKLNKEHHNCLKAIQSGNGTELRNASFD
jgi:hypothetical protein